MVDLNNVAQLPEARPYTVKEVAGRWRMSVPTVHRMINSGELSSFGPKGATRIAAAEVARVEGCASNYTGDTGTPLTQSTEGPNAGPSAPTTSVLQSKDLPTYEYQKSEQR